MTDEPDSIDETDDRDQPPRSGLKDPQRSIRTLGAMILGLETLVLLLTIVPLRMMRVEGLGTAITIMLTLSVACIVLAGFMRHAWAWHGGTLVQIALLVVGVVFHWSIAGVGVMFGLTWVFTLYVRRTLSRPPVRKSE